MYFKFLKIFQNKRPAGLMSVIDMLYIITILQSFLGKKLLKHSFLYFFRYFRLALYLDTTLWYKPPM